MSQDLIGFSFSPHRAAPSVNDMREATENCTEVVEMPAPSAGSFSCLGAGVHRPSPNPLDHDNRHNHNNSNNNCNTTTTENASSAADSSAQFSSSFWSPDFKQPAAGFDVLNANFKQQAPSAKELEVFFSSSATHEKSFGTNLQKLSAGLQKLCCGRDPQDNRVLYPSSAGSSFSPLWNPIKGFTDRLSRCHMDMSHRLQELAKESRKYQSDAVNQRSKKLQKSHISQTQSALKKYQASQKELLGIKSKSKKHLLKSSNPPNKDAKNVSQSSQHDKSSSYDGEGDSAYDGPVLQIPEKYQKDATRALNDYNASANDFNLKYEACVQEFERAEEEHLQRMRAMLDRYVVIVENHHVRVEHTYKQLKDELIERNESYLMNMFTRYKRTGPWRPGPLNDIHEIMYLGSQAPAAKAPSAVPPMGSIDINGNKFHPSGNNLVVVPGANAPVQPVSRSTSKVSNASRRTAPDAVNREGLVGGCRPSKRPSGPLEVQPNSQGPNRPDAATISNRSLGSQEHVPERNQSTPLNVRITPGYLHNDDNRPPQPPVDPNDVEIQEVNFEEPRPTSPAQSVGEMEEPVNDPQAPRGRSRTASVDSSDSSDSSPERIKFEIKETPGTVATKDDLKQIKLAPLTLGPSRFRRRSSTSSNDSSRSGRSLRRKSSTLSSEPPAEARRRPVPPPTQPTTLQPTTPPAPPRSPINATTRSRPLSPATGPPASQPLRPATSASLRKPSEESAGQQSQVSSTGKPVPLAKYDSCSSVGSTGMGHLVGGMQRQAPSNPVSFTPTSRAVLTPSPLVGPAMLKLHNGPPGRPTSTSAAQLPIAVEIRERLEVKIQPSHDGSEKVDSKLYGDVNISLAAHTCHVLLQENDFLARRTTEEQKRGFMFTLNNAKIDRLMLNGQMTQEINANGSFSGDGMNRYQRTVMVNYGALKRSIKVELDKTPGKAYYMFHIAKYSSLVGTKELPLKMGAVWDCRSTCTDIKIDFQATNSSLVVNPLSVIVPVTGNFTSVNLNPAASGRYIPDKGRIIWSNLTTARPSSRGLSSPAPVDAGRQMLHARLTQTQGSPSHNTRPRELAAQFIVNDYLCSGMDIELCGEGSSAPMAYTFNIDFLRRRTQSDRYFVHPTTEMMI